ncbi:MAG: FtsW/RodA/SpoVE family cell cycle protein [bacterium]|nr:FtsW/RodA/SpoVE family cell cycle protein [bacterium]
MSKTSFLPDLLITVPVILLLSLGILVIYSSDPKLAFQQALYALVGLGVYGFLAQIDVENFSPSIKYLYGAVLVLLIIVFLLGVETRGSLRWIPLGVFQLQPSEFAKPVLILLLSYFWSRNLPTWKNIGKSFLLILPVLLLVFKQPDLGTTLTLAAIWLIILVGSNVSLFKILALSGFSLIAGPLGWVFLKDYQKSRILSFLSPEKDPLGIGYNVIQATIAVGSGEFLGRGLGRGTQSRLRFLPEFRTDFMFASIAEEFGLVGSMIVLVLWGIVLARGFLVVGRSVSRMATLTVLGTLGMLFFQITVNVGMNIGLMPITGITLPLLSYGGSSVIATLISLSFISSAARSSRRNSLLD